MQTKQITRTALMIVLLVAAQYVTKSAGQFVTGSCVNLILAVCALLLGIRSAAVIALLSPFCAFLLGIGTPILQIVPAIALGNLAYVLLLALFDGKFDASAGRLIAVVLAAVGKFALLYLLVVKLLLPMLGLPVAQTAVLAATFSWPQLITALIGGTLSACVVPLLRKAVPNVKNGDTPAT